MAPFTNAANKAIPARTMTAVSTGGILALYYRARGHAGVRHYSSRGHLRKARMGWRPNFHKGPRRDSERSRAEPGGYLNRRFSRDSWARVVQPINFIPRSTSARNRP